jgi:hypothetical protein
MHGRGKSDSPIVAKKLVNKAGRLAAEPAEQRAEAEGNANQQTTCRAAPHQIRADDLAWSRSKRRWPGKVARVALSTRTRFQCLQTLDEGVHNDPRLSIGRMLRSTTFESISIRPSWRKRVRPFQRVRA